MKKFSMAVLLVSAILVATLVGSGLFFKAEATDSSYRQVVVFSEVLSLVMENYVDPVEADNLLEGAYEGMLRGLDPHAAYLSAGELTTWKEQSGDRSAGPGVTVLKGFGALQIVAVDPGSPADGAGLVAGDQIRAIGGELLRDLSLDQAVRLLRGPAGSTVEMQIIHPASGFSREELTLARKPRQQLAHSFQRKDGVLVLKIQDLTRLDAARLAEELAEYQDQGLEELLIDLRNDAEGSPRDLGPFAGLFHSGEAFRLVDRDGAVIESVGFAGEEPAWTGTVSLLVNGATAGAAEGFARLLQVEGPVKVYGEETYGMGSEPELFELPNGSGVLVAAREWRLVSGESWNDGGVVPDVKIRPTGSTYLERMDDQMEKVLAEMVLVR